jgi:hypothetical protein
MDDQKLHQLLEQLQAEIKQADNIDADGRDLLQEIDKDVHELLNRSGSELSPIHPGVLERFESTIDLLEATHPRITNYLVELMEILSNAGI